MAIKQIIDEIVKRIRKKKKPETPMEDMMKKLEYYAGNDKSSRTLAMEEIRREKNVLGIDLASGNDMIAVNGKGLSCVIPLTQEFVSGLQKHLEDVLECSPEYRKMMRMATNNWKKMNGLPMARVKAKRKAESNRRKK